MADDTKAPSSGWQELATETAVFEKVLQLYFLAIISGLALGVTVWFLASHWIASSITWVEDHRPELVGSKQLRVGEAVACGALILACLALAVWIARALWVVQR